MEKRYFIFDMDGVLVDSEPMHRNILKQAFKELKLDISTEYLSTLTGMSDIPAWTKIKKDFSLDETAQELSEFHKEIFYRELPNQKVEPVAGIIDFIHKLKEGNWQLSVASSSSERLIKHFTKSIGIIEYFDFQVSGQTLERSKPFPDIFLKVAERYSVSTDKFWVLEDSHHGVTAAKSAKMSCIGFQNPSSGKQDLSHADYVVNTIEEIDAILF